ncbi:bifunctional diaminohydroxyphosphoribosylaminopyrimidine deaminase/5-amino-6-(5-phosphoribosylamino)uracil reductase RibD [Idiomarina abyssalis]|jgi:diaminohydroxyphosphoribosylaminopyrimidine deaminase / 5-amino-6-(5-phosphoribosylamino)uracil reductase|uniref:bifunctional diaminohydroxyphosphoribosylaminopyrimidine deaminase/5-amino-6-(5-phosphoribosylamino)uracil reductase RibD n=1 Tax=Idiomarina abyssalis TaxID=86102 RepID=UPI002300029A|nr:bifunctional diaminohydroxyphosphoribosylaminopyrimidine deaminase/5-amino-6-(5-phosphoribosylamino)uracil reductase RibD [Idiomarina abyssalis]MDA6065532.1 bifunctional diaminohydroxyphosphoribosylaminopyrimidine deaminase/5-amino-6-(5-phosphoribosylamino)uracil reductase RibD [Idiomarina abyssalis]|tara:strand:+ start:9452 stop:10579 length:1128 start_codon:yes stop_codon:yes gene_type:complete
MTNLLEQQFDHIMMHRALKLARRGLMTTRPNPAVGCVITVGEEVIAEGWHHQAGEAHAEAHALRLAGTKAKGATAYVTLEPCSHIGRTPPCADALIEAGIARVVVAMRDPNPRVSGNGIKRLEEAGIRVDVGTLQSAAESLNPGFISRMTRQRPWLTLKMATSLDGKTALADGRSQWITSAESRSDVQTYRAQADAILTGAATVLADNPKLTVRVNQWPASRPLPEPLKQPVRIIIDSQHRVNDDARVFESPAPVWLVRTTPGKETRHPHCHELIIEADRDGKVCLKALMIELAKREINQVWTECGASLAGAIIEQQLCDRMMIYSSGQILGHHGRSVIDMSEPLELASAPRFKVIDRRQVGPDQRLVAVPQTQD